MRVNASKSEFLSAIIKLEEFPERAGAGASAFCFTVGGEKMGRPRKFKTVRQLEETWEAYKKDCDNRMVLTHDFSSKNSEFVSKELKRSVTYTI